MSFDWADLEFQDFNQEESVSRAWEEWLEEKSELDLDVADAVMTFLSQKGVFKLLPDCEMIMVVYGFSDESYIDLLSTQFRQKILDEEGSHVTAGDSGR